MRRTPRILLYSHDTFGLGHLRRNRKIAGAVRAHVPLAQITVATGSNVSDAFPPLSGVEFVRLPAVVKNSDGSYDSAKAGETLEQVLRRRSRLLVETAKAVSPDILITDKEPLGLLGEMEETLQLLRGRDCYTILGLRDILDSSIKLQQEWDGKGIVSRLNELYDEIWVYGRPDFHDPLAGIETAGNTLPEVHFMGFLGSPAPELPSKGPGLTAPPQGPYVLATAGGGADGAMLIKAVLAACEAPNGVKGNVVLLLGPFTKDEVRADIEKRAARLENITVRDFTPEPEPLIAGASGVVSMCGYNTFCEVLHFDKPALFVPREKPRLEQKIRAERAREFGIARMLRQSEIEDVERLAREIDALPERPRPSEAEHPMTLEGLRSVGLRIAEIIAELLDDQSARPSSLSAVTP